MAAHLLANSLLSSSDFVRTDAVPLSISDVPIWPFNKDYFSQKKICV